MTEPDESPGTVALIGTLDTKRDEMGFLRDLLISQGLEVLVIDTGILGEPGMAADVSRERIAHEGGAELGKLVRRHDEAQAQEVMARGLKRVIQILLRSGQIQGVLAIGGGQGSTIVAPTLKSLDLGFPKLLISTKLTQAGPRAYIGSKDVLLLPPVADLAGINRLTRRILTNAAGAMAGMMAISVTEPEPTPLAVMSMNGTVTTCGLAVKEMLEADGHEVLVFHSIGTGGEALEDYVSTGDAVGVIELGVNEIGNELFGGLASAGPDRMEAAGARGLPQVIVPGSADFINFLAPDTIPERYRHRLTHRHNPMATCIRTNVEENTRLGEVIAEKLNKATGPVVVLWPKEGLSSWDHHSGPFRDADADTALLESLKRRLRRDIELREYDCHINDPIFAKAVYDAFREVTSLRSETV